MTTRYELIRMLALNALSDDYEEPLHVAEQVAAIGRHYGFPVGAPDVTRALLDLVGLGWAKAYDLRTGAPSELQGLPSAERAGQYYYWITAQGRAAQCSFNDWPFEEDGTPASDWVPPAE